MTQGMLASMERRQVYKCKTNLKDAYMNGFLIN